MAFPYDLPSYLQPPSEAQKEQFDLERQQVMARQEEMMRQSFDRAQKKVVMQRMISEAQIDSQASGNPLQARYNAFSKYGDKLVDDPAQYENMLGGMETKLRQQKAGKDFQSKVDSLMGQVNPDTGEHFTAYEARERALPIMMAEFGATAGGISGLLRNQTQDRAITSRENIADKTLGQKQGQFDTRMVERRLEEQGKNTRADAKLQEQIAKDQEMAGYHQALIGRAKAASKTLDPKTKVRSAEIQSALTEAEKKISEGVTAENWDQVKKWLDRKSHLIGELETLVPDKTTPAAAEQPATGKVKVKNPSGKVGFIPANQLKDALQQGFEEVK